MTEQALVKILYTREVFNKVGQLLCRQIVSTHQRQWEWAFISRLQMEFLVILRKYTHLVAGFIAYPEKGHSQQYLHILLNEFLLPELQHQPDLAVNPVLFQGVSEFLLTVFQEFFPDFLDPRLIPPESDLPKHVLNRVSVDLQRTLHDLRRYTKLNLAYTNLVYREVVRVVGKYVRQIYAIRQWGDFSAVVQNLLYEFLLPELREHPDIDYKFAKQVVKFIQPLLADLVNRLAPAPDSQRIGEYLYATQ